MTTLTLIKPKSLVSAAAGVVSGAYDVVMLRRRLDSDPAGW